jgi:zinc protease
MMFKGTEKRGPGVIAREVEAAGGHINAYTSFDETVYYIDMAGRYARRGLDILGDMVFHPTFDPEEFAREKEVVVEEIKMGRDNPSRQLSKAIFAEAFQKHPYGRPIIGYEDTVRSLTREEAVEFHRDWYRPDNAVLVVAGDFDPSEFRPLIEEVFGGVADREGPSLDLPSEPGQRHTRVRIIREQVETARLALAYHVPAFAHPDSYAVDILADVLGEGRASRLYNRVKRERELVHQVSTWSYTPRDPGVLMINAQLDPDNSLDALSAMIEEIETLIYQRAGNEEVERAKLGIQVDHVQYRETMSGEARTAAQFEALTGDWRHLDNYLAGIQRVDPAGLQDAAARYLPANNLSVVLLLPQDAQIDLTEKQILAAVEKGAAQAEASRPDSREQAVELETFTLDNGARLLVKPDDSLPLVSLRAAFMGGLRYETPENNGINHLLAEVWDRATEDKGPEELARAEEDVAAQIQSFSGRNSLGVTAEFLNRYMDQGLALWAEILTRPALSPEEVQKAKPNILAAIQRQNDRLTARTFNLFSETLFNEHPYSLDRLGDPESVRNLTAQDVRSFYQRYIRPQGMVITVVGDVEPEDIHNRMNQLLKDFTGDPADPPRIEPPQRWEGIKTASEVVPKAQTHMVLGFLAAGLKSDDRYPLEVLDAVLSGMGGRLFTELRDKQSLAYSVTSFYRPGLDIGSFGFYIGFDPDKLDQVQTGFREIIRQLNEQPVTSDELDGAKEYILGNYEIELQEYSSQATEITYDVLYGLGADYRRRYVEGINAVTAEDVQRVARKYLDLDQAVEVSVGEIELK